MVSGYDKYFQIARCLRDEDLRADRQPEFTQLDFEMSFVEREDVLSVIERLTAEVFQKCLGVTIPLPLPRLKYADAMLKYGSDKPDLRYGMEIVELTDWAPTSGFSVFQKAVEAKGVVRALNAKKASEILSRRTLDTLTEFAKGYGAKGLAWIKIGGDPSKAESWQGPAAKNITESARVELGRRLNAEDGDVLFFGADSVKVVCATLGAVRVELGTKLLKLARGDDWQFLWIHSAPAFEWSDESQALVANHHPFTAPYAA